MARNLMNSGKRSRLYYLDHLRASLVILVVIHHIAMIYGASAPFYYFEPPPLTRFKAFQSLLVFALVNQSFFMGALFFLAGYFTPESFDHKRTLSFLKDKVLRLGIPLVVFAFVLNPVSGLGTYLMPASITGITGGPSWGDYPELVGFGPAWFLALLLVFNGGYVLWRLLTDGRARKGETESAGPRVPSKVPGPGVICLFMLALTGASYLMRILVPLGRSVAGFPTLAYLPQYLSFFVLGALANRRDWLRQLPARTGVAGGMLAAASAVFLLPLAFSGDLFSLAVRPGLQLGFGQGHWRSAVYAAWDSTFAVGLLLGLLVLYRWAFSGAGKVGAFLSAQSYTVYLVHTPVVVYLGYLMREINLATIPKFLLATAIFTPACFLVAWAIRRLPGVTKIL